MLNSRGKDQHVSIVLPIHNEAEVLKRQLNYLIDQSKKEHIHIKELILVENGSSDNSWSIIQRFAKQYPFVIPLRSSVQSYGQALKLGMQKAQAPIIVIFNADLINVLFVQQAIHLLAVVDIVVASKTLAASNDQRSTTRKLSTYFFNAFLRIVLNYPGTDTHGIKAFKNTKFFQETLKKCLTKNELLDTELIVRLTRNKALLVELPIDVKDIRPTRYTFHKRVYLTLLDFIVAMKSKYLAAPFFSELTVADDYGMSPYVNKAIFESLKKKQVQIISVLVTHASRSDITKLKRSLPSMNWSLHFNLLRLQPISNPQTVGTLVSKEGTFFSIGLFFWKLFWKQINLNHVKIELDAQYMTLKNTGIYPGYIDSEQHTHTFAPIAEIVSEFALTHHLRVRSESSTRTYLLRKPFRFCVYSLMNILLKWRYPGQTKLKSSYDAFICHPGTTYD